MNARTILIAEDDPWGLRLLEVGLRELGFEPIIARNGDEAIELFAETLPDAVAASVMLPKVVGLELSRRIKSSRAGVMTPIVLFGGSLGERDVLTRSRADAFLTQPVTPDAVAARLAMLRPPALETFGLGGSLPPGQRGEISLAAQPLPLALARLYQQKQSGVLHVRVPQGNAEIVLRDGRIIEARSPGWRETLAGALLRLQRVTPEALAELWPGRDIPEQWYEFGSTIVQHGLLPLGEPEKLWAAALVARVLETFGWTQGFHSFEPGSPQHSTTNLMLDTPGLIHWGLRRAALPDHALEQAVPTLTGRLFRHPAADETLRFFPLSASERWLLERADGLTALQTLTHQVEGDARASDALVRSAIVLHALGALTIDIPRLVPEEPSRAEHLLTGGPAEMLLSLWRAEATGIFSAETDTARFLLYLRRGQLVASRSNEIERLDSLLAQRGRIRSDVLPRIRQLVEGGKNVGEALIEERAITGQQLHAFVRGEVRAALGEMLKARELEVSFTELPLPLTELAPHEWDTAQAMVEVARAQDLGEVRRLVPSPEALVTRSPDAELATALALSPAERNLWQLLASPQPWRRLTGGALVSLADQQRALAVLLTLGLVRVVEGRHAAVETPSLPPKNASVPPRRRARDVLALPDEPAEEPAAAGDSVPRALYDALLKEKQALEARLTSQSEADESVVARDVFDAIVREKIELKARVAELLGEAARAEPVEDLLEEVEFEEKTSRFTRKSKVLVSVVEE